jgi:drug/metabolite transporter (DMT)-like permease
MVFVTGLLWGTIGMFSTILSKLGMDSSAVAFYRLLSASVLLIPVLLVKGKGLSLFRLTKRGLISCVLIGFISQAFYNLF